MTVEQCEHKESQFVAERLTVSSPLTCDASLGNGSPFATPQYANALIALGMEAFQFRTSIEGSWLRPTVGYLRRGRLNTVLELPSVPHYASRREFTDGLREFCTSYRVTLLKCQTFATSNVSFPKLPGEIRRRERVEYVLDLNVPDLASTMSRIQLRRSREAIDLKLQVRATQDASACIHHARLMNALPSRRDRGEDLQAAANAARCKALVDANAGTVFRAELDGQIMASALVLIAGHQAYLESLGESPEGRTKHASGFLLQGIALELQSRGVHQFNLGSAEPDSTFAQFKLRFGAKAIRSTATTLAVGSPWRRRLTTTVAHLRRNPLDFLNSIRPRCTVFRIYAVETLNAPDRIVLPGFTFSGLSEDELGSASVGDAEFRRRQLKRIERFGQSYAFAAKCEGHVTHVSWLLSAKVSVKEEVRVLALKANEAEITACETKAAYRGKKIYGFAIRELVAHAAALGMRRVYMKTTWSNKASQNGIKGAGLSTAGYAIVVGVPGRNIKSLVLKWIR